MKTLELHYPMIQFLIIGQWTSVSLRWLGLGGQTVKDLRRHASLVQSERQVIASQPTWKQTESQVPRFQFASTCESVWSGLLLLSSPSPACACSSLSSIFSRASMWVNTKTAEEKNESLVRVDRLAGSKLLVITDRQWWKHSLKSAQNI